MRFCSSGIVVCGACSSHEKQGVRVCDACFKAPSPSPSKLLKTVRDSPIQETILYNTQSICPRCAIVERKGYHFKPALVVEKEHKIWLRCVCTSHGIHDTVCCQLFRNLSVWLSVFDVVLCVLQLYCENPAFFKRSMRFCPPEEDLLAMNPSLRGLPSSVSQSVPK